MDSKQNTLCKLHTLRAVQIGSCITCKSASVICQTKGCIKHHEQSQKVHNIYTVRDIERITLDFINANNQKRKILKKLVGQYFQLLKGEIQSLYHEVQHSLNNLRFQNFLMDDEQRKLAQKLALRRYSALSCSEIARVIPKMIKCSSFEDKQFSHMKDYLYSERENLPKTVNSMILNLPYFRQDQTLVSVQKFTEISDQLLSNVNKKLKELTFRPRKLRIKYSDDDNIQIQSKIINSQEFIKNLENIPQLKQVQMLEFFCVWNISDEDFQIDFMDAVLSYPFLSALSIYTGYRVTSTAFIEEMVETKNIELKIFKKDWHF